MINDYAGGYNCYVKITTDGTTWDDVTPWTNPIAGSVAAALHTINVTGYISPTTQVMIDEIKSSQTKTPETIGELICQTVSRHVGRTPAIDDMCVVCIGNNE